MTYSLGNVILFMLGTVATIFAVGSLSEWARTAMTRRAHRRELERLYNWPALDRDANRAERPVPADAYSDAR